MSYEINQLKLSEQIISIAKKVSITAGLYILLSFIIVFFIYIVALFSIIGSPEQLIKVSNQEAAEMLISNYTNEIMIINMLGSIVLHYLLGGIYGMIKKGLIQNYADLGSAFGTIFSKNGLKALNVIIIIQVVNTVIGYFLDIAGFSLVGLGLTVLVQFLTYFAIPSIYIDGLGVRKSIAFSVKTINQKPGFLFAFIVFTYFLSFIGVLFLGIGIILTLPLNYIVAYSLYKNIQEQIS